MESKQLKMVDITHKKSTLRTAVAQAIVHVSSKDTIEVILNKTVLKAMYLP